MITAEGMFLLSKDRNGECYFIKRDNRMYNIQAMKRVNSPSRDWFHIGDTINLGGGSINASTLRDGVIRATGIPAESGIVPSQPTRVSTVNSGDMFGELPARSTTSTSDTDDGVINHAEPQYYQFSFKKGDSMQTLAVMKRFDEETESQFLTRFYEFLNILAPYNNDDALTSMRHEESLS